MNRNLETHASQRGEANIWLILTIVFMVITVGLGGGFAWALTNYFDQKNNVDTKVATAVTDAVKKQADKDAATFEEEDKKPNRTFAGPEDFGSLSFSYPKTWSVYVADDASDGSGKYEAYLNPVLVPVTGNDKTQYALRVSIQTEQYDEILGQYTDLVKEGKLKSSTIKVNGADATRLEGDFTDDIRGIAVLFKLRDKTVTLRTDADTFRADFDALVTSTKFNQ
jgi:hypothetical protein